MRIKQELFIDSINTPEPIKESLKDLSKSINFSRESTKGRNGYLFFGYNKVLNKTVAVKYYYWGGDKRFHAEPSQLSTINSPNVVRILDANLIDDDYAYFITPYYANGDLEDYIRKQNIGTLQAVDLVSGLLSGITHLQHQRLVHRDLKPQNVFLSDKNSPMIGDFGSVRRIPEDDHTVPGSGHSVLYRPPETITNGRYGFRSDLYQIGLIFFQLLGGSLPYEETAWLNKKQKKEYASISDQVDKTLLVDNILKVKIKGGKVVNMNTLPPWVPQQLKRVIRKAIQIDPNNRFDIASAFTAKLHELRPHISNWKIVDGFPTRFGRKKYFRIVSTGNKDQYSVEKKVFTGWRADRTFQTGPLEQMVQAIERS